MTRPNILSDNEIPDSLPPFTKTQSPKSFLYTKILKNYVGEQGAYVYALLATNERLAFKRLLQLSRLKSSRLKKILVSLIQLNCVVHYSKSGRSDSNSKSQMDNFYYYPNEEGCFKFLYADDIIRCIRKEYEDEMPATIVQNVLSMGHLTVRAFFQHAKTDKDRCLRIQKAFKRLVDDNWLSPIGKNSFLNVFDLFDKTFKKVAAEYNRENPESKTISQTKRMHMIKSITGDNFLQLLQEEHLHAELHHSSLKSLMGNEADDDADEIGISDMINTDLPLTFSFERYLKRVRSIHLASEARHRIGEISSGVYALALNHVELRSPSVRSREAKLQRLLANVGQTTVGLDPHADLETKNKLSLKDQSTGLVIRVPDVYRQLKSNGKKFGITESDLIKTIYDPADSDDIGSKRPMNALDSDVPPKKAKLEVTESEENDDIEFESTTTTDSNNEVLTLILQHLKLLTTDDNIPFLRETSPGVFYIPFTELVPEYTKHTFKQYIKHIMDPACLRIYNYIEERHLTDEKMLAKHILIKESDIRTHLNKMQKLRLVEVQEIPKTQDRSAIRANFAFRVKYRNGLEVFKNSLIFNMGEVLDSLDDIRMDNKILLDKVSRADVKGKEQELLLTSELVQLQKFYEFERQALAKFCRLRSSLDVFEFMSEL
ncbi:hypothetical protein FOA43_001149 [Brettanomyces nanus]|uniref:DNA-directed RNA polymerase III subunit RPC3 n=1 Tax=Eeniella nana TaxID=13502 RepID=A0A875S3F0_EENNA|nr:uncharacterized protein FOA43_001149 [Brettanomyces nanus]QPG73834.1 hypothetical protein FOA43_001149 [Brettanomyces nanus]